MERSNNMSANNANPAYISKTIATSQEPIRQGDPGNEVNPLLSYLNGEHEANISDQHTGTVPALPLKPSDTNTPAVTTSTVTKTVSSQRPSNKEIPPEGRAFEQQTSVTQQIPAPRENLYAPEVNNSRIEPAHSASRETAQRINQVGVGPVALEPLVGNTTVAKGLQKAQDASDTIKPKLAQASDTMKNKTQETSNAIKNKSQQASSAVKSTAAAAQQQFGDVQHAVQDKFHQIQARVAETLHGTEANPGLVERISGTVRNATNSAATGVRRTADNITKNEAVQQTVPTVVEAATSSYYFSTAFLKQYLHSFRPFALAMLQQPFYVQLIAGLSLLTHGISPLFYLDKWCAHTVLQCYVLSVFLSHLIYTSTGHLRLLFAAHLAMLPIMWSLFWETESQSSSLANLRDEVHAGNAMSFITHPMAIRHYTYVLWTRAVFFVTTAIFTLDFVDIDLLWQRSSRQRANIANTISKRIHQGKEIAASAASQVPSKQGISDEITFDEIPVGYSEDIDFDPLLSRDHQSSDDNLDASPWQQNLESKPFDFDTFMDDSHLTKQAVQSEEKPDKMLTDIHRKKVNFVDSKRFDDYSTKRLDNIQSAGNIYPVAETTTIQSTEAL